MNDRLKYMVYEGSHLIARFENGDDAFQFSEDPDFPDRRMVIDLSIVEEEERNPDPNLQSWERKI